MKNLVLGVNDAIYRTCVIVAATAIVIMATIIPWGVFSRYALGQGLGWPEQIAILLMVLFTFVGAAASYRAGAHMACRRWPSPSSSCSYAWPWPLSACSC